MTPTPTPNLAQLWEQLCQDLNRPQETVLLWFLQAAMQQLAGDLEDLQTKLLRIQTFGADAVPLNQAVVPGQTEGSWAAKDAPPGGSAQGLAEASQLRAIRQLETRFAFLCQLHRRLKDLQEDKWVSDLAAFLRDRHQEVTP